MIIKFDKNFNGAQREMEALGYENLLDVFTYQMENYYPMAREDLPRFKALLQALSKYSHTDGLRDLIDELRRTWKVL